MDEPRHPDPPAEADQALAAADLPSNYFEIYRLAVEMADRISARRGIANSFFLTADAGVVALLASGAVRWSLAIAGILVSVVWWALLKSYRDLNSAKFEIILAMEERLPVRVYGDEWDRLRREPARFALRKEALRSWFGQYRELGRIERIVPWSFALIHLAEGVRDLPWCGTEPRARCRLTDRPAAHRLPSRRQPRCPVTDRVAGRVGRTRLRGGLRL